MHESLSEHLQRVTTNPKTDKPYDEIKRSRSFLSACWANENGEQCSFQIQIQFVFIGFLFNPKCFCGLSLKSAASFSLAGKGQQRFCVQIPFEDLVRLDISRS
jgi:hypothetical protein